MTSRPRALARRRTASSLVVGAAVAAALAVLAGCDPCAGVPSCRGEATVSYTGRIVDFVSGRGTPGVTVVFRRTDGVALDADSLVAVTDGEGRYRLTATAHGTGEVAGAVTVRPPSPLLPYTVPDVRLVARDVRGAGGSMPTYLARPYVSFVGGINLRREDVALPYAAIEFVPKSGARLLVDAIVSSTDPSGYFYLQAPAAAPGVLVGDLRVTGGGLTRSYTIQNVALSAIYEDRLPAVNATWKLGASLDYALQLFYRGPSTPVVGASVEFQRTSGIRLAADVVGGTSDAAGRVVLRPVPAGEGSGEVVGDVTVRAPGLARPYVVRGVRLRTFDAEELRLAGVYGVGYAAVAVGELRFRGDRLPLADADVSFISTGGVLARPDTSTARSLADGRFGLAIAADTSGDIVGDLLVRRVGTSAPERIRGVHLAARGDDSVRFIGNFAVGAHLLYNGVLLYDAHSVPAAGWTVTFRRTGGIRLVTDTLVSTAVEWGGFALDPLTREEGTVEGTLEARSPSGDRVVRLGPVRLTTHRDDEVHLAGNWLLDNPAVRAVDVRIR